MGKNDDWLKQRPNGRSNLIAWDATRFFVFIVSWLIGIVKSCDLFAKYCDYNLSIIGKPIFIFLGKSIYNPLLYFTNLIKYGTNKQYSYYALSSLTPFIICLIFSLLFIIFWDVLKQLSANRWNIHGTARFAGRKDLKKNGLLYPIRKGGAILAQTNDAIVKADRGDTALHLKIKPRLLSSQWFQFWKYLYGILPTQNGYRAAGRVISHTGKTNTLLLAPTGEGKGVGLLLPTFLNYKGSIIIFDPKGENFKLSAGWRATFSHVLKFAPCSNNTIRFNPIMAIRDGDESAYRDANLIADILFAPAKVGGGGSSETEAYFSNSAKDLVTTAIMHIRFCDDIPKEKKSLNGLLTLLSATDDKSLDKLRSGKQNAEQSDQGNVFFLSMIDAKHTYHFYDEKEKKFITKEATNLHNIIVNGALRTINTNPKEKASVFKTVFSKIQLFEDPMIKNATSGNDFEIEDFMNPDKPISLYLVVPYSDIQRISSVFKILISFMLRKFSEGETSFGSIKLKYHLLICLDEFPVLGCFPDIAQVMGVLRGYGINFMIVCQALNQLVDLYGVNHPFLDHCKMRVVYAPGKVEDAKAFTDGIGNESVHQMKVSRSGNQLSASRNVNYSDHDSARALLDPTDLMRLPGDKCLISVQGMQPYIAVKNVYYMQKPFNVRMKIDAPSSNKKTNTEILKELQKQLIGLPSQKKELVRIRIEKRNNEIIFKRAVKYFLKDYEEETKNIDDIYWTVISDMYNSISNKNVDSENSQKFSTKNHLYSISTFNFGNVWKNNDGSLKERIDGDKLNPPFGESFVDEKDVVNKEIS